MSIPDKAQSARIFYPRSQWAWLSLVIFLLSFFLWSMGLSSTILLHSDDIETWVIALLVAIGVLTIGTVFFLFLAHAIFAWSGRYFLQIDQSQLRWKSWRQNKSFTWEQVERIRYSENGEVILITKNATNNGQCESNQIPDIFTINTSELYAFLK